METQPDNTLTGINLNYSSELNIGLIVNFFLHFARAEYALKRAGYVRAWGDKNKVEADWDKFAADVKNKFTPDSPSELSYAVRYLLDNPPMNQILNNAGVLDWADSGCGSNNDLPCLLVLVRRVRNNLFHGGKFPFRPIPEVARNETLLHNSLVVLGAALQLSPRVMNLFSEEIT